MNSIGSAVVLEDRSRGVEVVAEATRGRGESVQKEAGPGAEGEEPAGGEGGGSGEGAPSAEGPCGARRGAGGSPKKSLGDSGDRTESERREGLMAVVAQQRTLVGIAPACAALSVARATFSRWQKPKGGVVCPPRPVPRAPPPAPAA